MKVTSVELHPAGSLEIITLSFKDPRGLNSYNMKNIFGLDADEIISKYYGASSVNTDKYYSLSVEKRELIIRINLNPKFEQGESFSNLRDALYKMIASSRTGLIEIKFKNDTEIMAVISGFITKLESPQFTKTPELQLKINPLDPMLKAPVRTNVDVSLITTTLANILDVKSTAPHGFLFSVEFVTATASFKITDPNETGWAFEVTPAGGFLVGDVLFFSSEINNKYLYLMRAGVAYHLANTIIPGSFWPIIFPGQNSFTITNPSTVTWETLAYYPTYWGI